jgi:hypothetical protein
LGAKSTKSGKNTENMHKCWKFANNSYMAETAKNGPTLSKILLSILTKRRPILKLPLRTKSSWSTLSKIFKLDKIAYNLAVLIRQEHL